MYRIRTRYPIIRSYIHVRGLWFIVICTALQRLEGLCFVRSWLSPALRCTRETSFSSTATKREDTSTRIPLGKVSQAKLRIASFLSCMQQALLNTPTFFLHAYIYVICSSKYSRVTVFNPDASAPAQDPGFPNVHC